MFQNCILNASVIPSDVIRSGTAIFTVAITAIFPSNAPAKIFAYALSGFMPSIRKKIPPAINATTIEASDKSASENPEISDFLTTLKSGSL